MPPETIIEDEEEEVEEENKFEPFVPFGEELIDEERLKELEDQLETGPNSSQYTED